ncbi:agmatinase [bacterium]|nr:agmatinase [bacterium]
MIKNLTQTNKEDCFLGSEPCSYDKAKFVIIPAPIEKTVSYGHGAKLGPESIIQASPFLEFYDEDLGVEPQNQGICTLKSYDYEPLSIEKALIKLQEICFTVFKDKKVPFILGGEHSISIAPVKALKQINDKFTVIHFDAHTDLRDEYESSKNSHACVMKRIFEENIPAISLGIRSVSKEEADFIKQNNMKIYYAKEIAETRNKIDQALSQIKTNDIYITFDIDVFDPSIIPTTGTPEPGGLFWYDIIYFLEKLRGLKKNILGFDLVELAPDKNLSHPQFTCAKLIFKTMSYLF